MADEAAIERESIELLRRLIRNACVVLQTPAEQAVTIRRMRRMPESGSRADEVPRIIEAFRTLSGTR